MGSFVIESTKFAVSSSSKLDGFVCVFCELRKRSNFNPNTVERQQKDSKHMGRFLNSWAIGFASSYVR